MSKSARERFSICSGDLFEAGVLGDLNREPLVKDALTRANNADNPARARAILEGALSRAGVNPKIIQDAFDEPPEDEVTNHAVAEEECPYRKQMDNFAPR